LNRILITLRNHSSISGKHFREGRVDINISDELGILYILNTDDGPVFDTVDFTLSGLGLMHIFERAKLLNGKAAQDSSPGKGTRWTIAIPQ